jgi:hypothetical protein
MKTLFTFRLIVLPLALVASLSLFPNFSFAQDGGGDDPEEVEWVFTPYDSIDYYYEGEPGTYSGIADQNGFMPDFKVALNLPAESMSILYTQLVGPSEVSIIDLGGKVHMKAAVGRNAETEGAFDVNTSGLSPGIYMIRLTSGIYQSISKIMIR